MRQFQCVSVWLRDIDMGPETTEVKHDDLFTSKEKAQAKANLIKRKCEKHVEFVGSYVKELITNNKGG